MSDWLNWQDFAAANATPMQQQADENEMMYRQQREQVEKALSGLGDAAAAQARDGKFSNVSQLSGYSALMAGRDAALKAQSTPLQAAPWEADMQKPGEQKSPWADLQKRLGAMNNKYATANTERVNQQNHERALEEQRQFQKEQEAKLKATHGTHDKATEDYIRWSDAVQNAGSHYKGSPGAGAYYDAAQGTGPKPVQQPWGNSPNVKDMQKKFNDINQNQLMPRTNRGFGTQGPGSNGWW